MCGCRRLHARARPLTPLPPPQVELGLLASAKCLIRSDSGFSNIALWWGGAKCTSHVDACVETFRQIPIVAAGMPQLSPPAPPTMAKS
jgi:hypothetical protein